MKLRANCKINIGLDVLRRRADGFHDVSTVMVPVRELYDRLEIEPAIETELVQLGLPVDCPPEDNICLRAWRLMHERYGAGPVRIVLDKRVPYGAGLGGGSADATAVVQGVDALFGLRLAEAELIDCAAALGSDTAFFVRNAPQLCTGRGEVMRPVKPAFGGYTLLIVKPDEAVSTREAYAGVRPAVPAESLEESMRLPVTAWQGRVKNDFEPHVFAAHPRLAVLKESLLKAGAVYADVGQRLGSFRIVRRSRAGAKLYPAFRRGISPQGAVVGALRPHPFRSECRSEASSMPGGPIYSRPLTGILAMRRS